MANIVKVAARDVDGIEMGVLSDGRGFLSLRSLASLCGISPSTMSDWVKKWDAGQRDGKLSSLLVDHGLDANPIYEPIVSKGGATTYAFPDDVCMTVLEYYAFEVKKDDANQNYRRLARAGLRLFIYAKLGYESKQHVPLQWRQFHDRLLLNPSPPGYFSVFREMSELVLTAMQAGLTVDEHTVPDISVGIAWSKYWEANGLEVKYGPKRKQSHSYPTYFPQAAANAGIEANIYPLAALGEYRTWILDVYLPEKFPKYIKGKVQKKQLPPHSAELILAAFEPNELPAKEPVPF